MPQHRKKIALIMLLATNLGLSKSALGTSHFFIVNLVRASLMNKDDQGPQDAWQAGFDMADSTCLELAQLWEDERCPLETRVAKLERIARNYRVERCRNFRYYGGCPYKNRCRHAHQLFQLRTATEQNDSKSAL